MILYKKLPSKFTSTIQHSMLDQIQKVGYKNIANQHNNDPKWYLDYVRGLDEFLTQYQLKDQFQGAWLSGLDAGASFEAHVDRTSTWRRHLAVNIPIQGTKNTVMNWYNQATFVGLSHHDRYGTTAHWSDLISDYPSLELLEPYMIRTDIPHNVENNSSDQRIVISLRFDPEPFDQWPESFVPFVLPPQNQLIPGQAYKFQL